MCLSGQKAQVKQQIGCPSIHLILRRGHNSESNWPFYPLFIDHQGLILYSIGDKLSHFNQEPKTTWKTHGIPYGFFFHLRTYAPQQCL